MSWLILPALFFLAGENELALTCAWIVAALCALVAIGLWFYPAYDEPSAPLAVRIASGLATIAACVMLGEWVLTLWMLAYFCTVEVLYMKAEEL